MGMTHGYADYQDLFVEKFRNGAGDKLEYKAAGEWVPAEHRVEEIRINGASSRLISVVRTRHGPIILGNPENGSGVAFSHPGTNRGTPWANTLLGLLRARSADEVEESLRDWTEPVNNFVYAGQERGDRLQVPRADSHSLDVERVAANRRVRKRPRMGR